MQDSFFIIYFIIFEVAPNVTIFSSFPIQKGICNFSVDSGDGTVAADECDNNLLPEPLTSLFDCEAVNLEKALLKACVRYFYQILLFCQMIALQKLWKMLFVSSKNKALFVLEIFNFL